MSCLKLSLAKRDITTGQNTSFFLEAQHIPRDLRCAGKKQQTHNKKEEIITADLCLEQVLQFQGILLWGWKWRTDNWLESFLASNMKDWRVLLNRQSSGDCEKKKKKVLDKSVKKKLSIYSVWQAVLNVKISVHWIVIWIWPQVFNYIRFAFSFACLLPVKDWQCCIRLSLSRMRHFNSDVKEGSLPSTADGKHLLWCHCVGVANRVLHLKHFYP